MAQDAYVTPTITGSGTTWAQYKTGGLKLVIDKLIAANAAKANPTEAATTGETVTTGGLAAGKYFVAYTWVDAFGETTIGASESSEVTATDTSHLTTVTVPSKPTGVQSINIYVTPLGGASGSERLYATGVTGTTFGLTYALPNDQPGAVVPAVNTTGAAMHVQHIYSIFGSSQSKGTLVALTEGLSNYLSGMPISRNDIVRQHIYWAGITKLWYTALNEIGTLVQANMPTAHTAVESAVGFPQFRWTLP